jgi:hypothetical protein
MVNFGLTELFLTGNPPNVQVKRSEILTIRGPIKPPKGLQDPFTLTIAASKVSNPVDPIKDLKFVFKG